MYTLRNKLSLSPPLPSRHKIKQCQWGKSSRNDLYSLFRRTCLQGEGKAWVDKKWIYVYVPGYTPQDSHAEDMPRLLKFYATWPMASHTPSLFLLLVCSNNPHFLCITLTRKIWTQRDHKRCLLTARIQHSIWGIKRG